MKARFVRLSSAKRAVDLNELSGEQRRACRAARRVIVAAGQERIDMKLLAGLRSHSVNDLFQTRYQPIRFTKLDILHVRWDRKLDK